MFIAIANAIGAGKVASYVSKLIKNFKTRVLLASGIFESETCLKSNLEGIGNNILKQASLVITPNAYNAGTLFSVIPNTSLGDFDVTRATSATRVDSQGLIEIPRTNLRRDSDMFASASWTKTNITITPNTVISPSGLQDADTIRIGVDVSSVRHRLFQSETITSGVIYNASFFLKKAEHVWIQICAVTGFPLDIWANFNLDNGTIGNTGGANTIAKIESVGNGWYRCSVSGISNSSGSFSGLEITTTNNTNSGRYPSYQSLVEENVCYVWGAQLETSVSPTTYIPTTSVARTRFQGITQDGLTASNIPRLDYTNASCPSILVEPQRTNLVFPSATATTQTRAVTATAHTLSFYGTGSVTLSGVATGTLNGTGANNRVRLTFTPTAGNLTLTVSGSVTDWQLEAGANDTSYIPTEATTMTRNADVISKSGISSLIGQTEGSIYIEFYQSTRVEGIKSLLQVFTNTTTDFISIQTVNNSNTAINFSITVSSIPSSGVSSIISGLNKICIVYSTSGSKVFVNGSLTLTLANVNLPPMSNIALGHRNSARQWEAGINELVLWNNQLSDAQAIQLTTL